MKINNNFLEHRKTQHNIEYPFECLNIQNVWISDIYIQYSC